MMVRSAQTLATSGRKPFSSISTKSSTGGSSLFVHWFRLTDLRLHDNPALQRAVEGAKKDNNNKSSGIVPIFCFDPRVFGDEARSEFGSLKCGPKRARFILESVADLRLQLERRGSGLVVAHGQTEDVMAKLLKHVDSTNEKIPRLTCQQEVCSEELAVDKAVRAAISLHHPKSSLDVVWGSTLYELDDLPFEDGPHGIPNTFTPFRNKVEKNCQIPKPIPVPSKADLTLATFNLDGLERCSLKYMPSLEDLGYTPAQVAESTTHDDRGVMPFTGGETAALARVQTYLWDKDLLKVYFDTRNGMIGPDYSTKFAPWLAHGCLSPRYVARECYKYEQERVANKSTYWVVFELLWRDFFKFFAMKHGNQIFFRGGTSNSDQSWGFNRRVFDAWKEGRTGYPLVDANMRELAATGFMSNRGRQNVCSFLAMDLKQDWRYGADYFESMLLDYDVHSNWGNWCSGEYNQNLSLAWWVIPLTHARLGG